MTIYKNDIYKFGLFILADTKTDYAYKQIKQINYFNMAFLTECSSEDSLRLLT